MDKSPKTETESKDVLGSILSQGNDNDSFTDSTNETSQRESTAQMIAFRAIDALPTETNQNSKVLSTTSEKESMQKSEEEETPTYTPVIPNPEPIPNNPEPSPVDEVPQIITDNQVIHVGTIFNPYQYATAIDSEDGDITNRLEVIFNNVNPNQVGNYTVTYRVIDQAENQVEITITITVTNDAPIIQANDQTISLGKPFDVRQDVTATDTEDGDMTSAIRVLENTVDTQVEGEYIVTYQVTDSQGVSTEKTIHIQVENDAPVIDANDQTITVGESFDPLEQVTAHDIQDGNLTQAIVIQENNVNTQKSGVYTVVYEVTDNNGKTTVRTITVTVQEPNHAPMIEMETEEITLNLGDTPDWLVGVQAFDEEEGDLTNLLEVDASQVDLTQPGDYTVIYQVTDQEGLTTLKKVMVHVVE
ncbi:immunoglobulin-like domain-containing protein [Listeria goaensis]|uniref:immunoglobulin-like domain-containing protein n=1 Tax=Listeria goaensis TaxID=1649188 RepID=UPI0013564C73|nr:immunoglobulin-like domain-containing protein [Listeria goaensis]